MSQGSRNSSYAIVTKDSDCTIILPNSVLHPPNKQSSEKSLPPFTANKHYNPMIHVLFLRRRSRVYHRKSYLICRHSHMSNSTIETLEQCIRNTIRSLPQSYSVRARSRIIMPAARKRSSPSSFTDCKGEMLRLGWLGSILRDGVPVR